MNTSLRPLQLLLGIMLSLLAVVVVSWKLNSARPDEASAANLGSAQVAARTPVSQKRIREHYPRSAEVSLVSSAPSNTPFLATQNTNSFASPAPLDATTAVPAGCAKLMRNKRRLISQMAHATSEERHHSIEKWHEENSDELAARQQLAIQMGAESRSLRLQVPFNPRIPENATPELREFLTARHAVMQEQTEMMNQIQNATPEGRHEALEKWYEQNITRFEAMQTAASRLSESSPPPGLPEH